MNPNQFLIDSIRQSHELVAMHLADFTDAELLVRPVPGANHAAWQLQQVANFDVIIANTLAPDSTPPFPEQYKATKANVDSDDAAQFMKKDEVLAVLKSASEVICKTLATATQDELEQPTPEGFRDFAPTMGNLVALSATHGAMHLGQIQVIRRKLGKVRVF